MTPGPKIEPHLDGVRARTLSLDDMTIDMAKVLGANGSASQGIREAVRFTYQAYQANQFTPGRTIGAPYAPGPVQAPVVAAQPAAPDAPPALPDAPP
jgi:hypothetical protein